MSTHYVEARWTFFSEQSESQWGWVTDLDSRSCILRTDDPIESKRWIRLVMDFRDEKVALVAVGRVTKSEASLEDHYSPQVTLYKMKVEFNYDLDLIFALSKRNLRVFSCRKRNAKSSKELGFLA
jgi:hypothetical protein